MSLSIDEAIQAVVFGNADMDLYSAEQVTHLVSLYFIEDADAEAECQLA